MHRKIFDIRIYEQMKISLKINKKKLTLDVPPNRTLSELLRWQGFWSVKHGCETGDCGNCTVIVDGCAVNSCIMLAAQAEGKSVETFESIHNLSEIKLLQEIFMDFGEIDCGYCIPAMMMSMKALVQRIPDPTEEEVIDALAGNLCRCTTSMKPIENILDALRKMQGKW